jgi:phage N-6-adenine-methyltransferase
MRWQSVSDPMCGSIASAPAEATPGHDANGIAYPTPTKAPSARKREFAELPNRRRRKSRRKAKPEQPRITRPNKSLRHALRTFARLPELSNTRQRGVVPFDPARARERDSEANSVIAHARRVRDWPLLEQAVDQKIEDQSEFVAWWRTAVTPAQSPGRSGRKSSADRRTIPMRDAEALSGIRNQQVARWRQRLRNIPSYKASLYGAAWRAAMNGGENVRGHSGDDEWHTPAEIFPLVRAVLGSIDLDPASNAEAQKIVKAKHFYTKADSGLAHRWHGHVFLNPPYSQPLITQFVAKLLHELRAGRVTAAILLTNDSTDTEWFHRAMAAAEAICFTRGRIKFRKWTGEVGAPPQGQAFFYFGPERSRFIQIFSALGRVLMRAEAAESQAEFSEAAE